MLLIEHILLHIYASYTLLYFFEVGISIVRSWPRGIMINYPLWSNVPEHGENNVTFMKPWDALKLTPVIAAVNKKLNGF